MCQKKGCQPYIADRAVWETTTKGGAGITWENVVERILKGLGADQEDILSVEKFAGYNTKVKEE